MDKLYPVLALLALIGTLIVSLGKPLLLPAFTRLGRALETLVGLLETLLWPVRVVNRFFERMSSDAAIDAMFDRLISKPKKNGRYSLVHS